MAAFKTLYC